MQQKNLIVFLIFSMLILIGWPLLERQIWPPKLRLTDEEAKQVAREVAPLVALNALPGLPGAVAAVHAASHLDLSLTRTKQIAELAALQAKSKLPPEPVHPTDHWVKIPFPIAPAAFGTNPVFPLAAEVALLSPDRRKVVLEAAKRFQLEQMLAGVKSERVTVGEEAEKGPKYHLRARLTTKGAGVEQLILNRFQRADEEGRPVFVTDAKGNRLPAPMELIQEDPFRASFLMFLYPPGEPQGGKEPRPIDTLGKQLWQLVKTDGKAVSVNGEGVQTVVFQTTLPGHDDVVVRKIYTLAPQQYHLDLTLEFERRADAERREATTFQYQLAGAHGTPIEGEWYTTIFRNAMIGIVDASNNLWRDLQDSRTISHRGGGNRYPEADNKASFVQYAGVVLQYFTSQIVANNNQAPKADGGVEPRDLIVYARPTLETDQFKGHIVGIRKASSTVLIVRDSEKGFSIDREFILLPRARERVETQGFKEGDPVIITYYEWDQGRRFIATDVHRGQVLRGFLDDISVRVKSWPVELRPGAKVVHKYLLYNGPAKVRLLEQFGGDAALSPPDLGERYADTLHLRTLTDYPSPGWFGEIGRWTGLSSLIILFTRLMHWLLFWLHYLLPSYGLNIILLTVIVRGLMFPITRKSVTSMNKMQALAPEMKKVQEKYKNDPQAKSQAMMELYRKHNVSPLGGCLPMLLQMPIFFGLYFCLQESIHFRLAPFLWITNLAAPDMLWRWGEGIPWISDPDSQGSMFYLGPFLNILPIIAVALMVVQQKLLMPPAVDEQQEMQQKMMMWMSLFIGVLFYKVAAGLCIYFIVSSVWGVTERKLLPKKQTSGAVPHAGAAVNVKSPKGPPPRPGKGPKGKKPSKSREPEGAMDKVKGWWNEVLKQAKKK